MTIYDLDVDQLERIIQLTRKFDGVPMDLEDKSLLVVAELTGYKEIASIDRGFYVYRNVRNNYLTITNVFICNNISNSSIL